MSGLKGHIRKSLSFRLSLRVIAALAILLLAALSILLIFSRKALTEEAISGATQTLEATVKRIDNIFLDVEQSTGNVYFKMVNYVQQPEKMEVYAQRLVDENPYIVDYHLTWLNDTAAADTKTVGWLDTQTHHENREAFTTFRLPIYSGQKIAALFDVDVSLTQLSKIMLEGKPSPNSYCVLLGKDGKIIVFPDSTFLNENAFEMAEKYNNNEEKETIAAMVSGETGYRSVRLEGAKCYVFFKPFERVMVKERAESDLGWSAAIIYPEDDIFGDFRRLHNIVLIIAAIGLLLLFASCRLFIHHQLVPLRQLEMSARRIAEGSYDEPIPDSRRRDEVGRLHKHFQNMQQSLSTRVGELQRATTVLQERGEVLQAAYEQAQAGDRMKTNFLYNMSDQMMSPVGDICDCVMTINKQSDHLDDDQTNSLVEEIQQQGGKITALLNQLITDSEKIMN